MFVIRVVIGMECSADISTEGMYPVGCVVSDMLTRVLVGLDPSLANVDGAVKYCTVCAPCAPKFVTYSVTDITCCSVLMEC